MTAPRKIVSAIGHDTESARAQIEALGPVLSSTPAPIAGQVPAWDGTSWVPGSGGGTPGTLMGVEYRTLIYMNTPIPPGQTEMFNNWTDMMAVYATMAEPKQITIWQSDPLTPLVADAGTWDVNRITALTVSGIVSQLQLPTGCFFRNLSYIGGGVILGNSGDSGGLIWQGTPFSPGLVLDCGARIQNFGGATTPLIVWDQDLSLNLNITMFPASSIIGTSGPVIDVTPAGAYTSRIFMFCYGGCLVGPNTISGSDAGGFAQVIFRTYVGARIFLQQPGWTASTRLGDWGTFRVFPTAYLIPSRSPVTQGSHFASVGELVRVEPDGSLIPILITLPDPLANPYLTVVLKKTNDDIVTQLEVEVVGGSSIDGQNPYVAPATPRLSLTFYCDESGWVVI